MGFVCVTIIIAIMLLLLLLLLLTTYTDAACVFGGKYGHTNERAIGQTPPSPSEQTIIDQVDKELHSHITHRKQHGRWPSKSRYRHNKWVPWGGMNQQKAQLPPASPPPATVSFDATSVNQALSIIPPTAQNAKVVTDASLQYCLDMSYNATSATYVVLASQLTLPKAFSKSAWIKPRSPSGLGSYQHIVSSNPSTETINTRHYFGLSQQTPGWGSLDCSLGRSFSVAKPYAFPVDEWTHVATTTDGVESIVYVNGVEIGRKRCPCSAKSWQGNGGQGLITGLNFDGCIQSVRVWNQTLSSTDVANEYASYTLITPAPTTQAPTTVQPTTVAPTTPSPTTLLTPTTVQPTTLAPTTVTPTTQTPTTVQPTNQPPPSQPSGTTIVYHGGTLIVNSPSLYFVFYGNWSTLDPASLVLLPEFAANLGGTPEWNINSMYYQNISGVVKYVPNQLTFKGYSIDTSYSYGTSLSDSAFYYIIKNQINAGFLPPLDPNGVYLVLTSPDVDASSGLCRTYCAFHTASSIGGVRFRYGMVRGLHTHTL